MEAVWEEAQGFLLRLGDLGASDWSQSTSGPGSLTHLFFNLRAHWRLWRTVVLPQCGSAKVLYESARVVLKDVGVSHAGGASFWSYAC